MSADMKGLADRFEQALQRGLIKFQVSDRNFAVEILTALRSHDALVAALKYCIENIEGIKAETDIPSMVILARARAALTGAAT